MRTALPLILLALLVAAPSAGAATRCSAPGAKTLLQNAEARVFTVKGKGAVKRRYFGCLRGRKPILIASDVSPRDPEKTHTSNARFRLTGHWVAWASTAQSDFGVGEFGRSIEARSLRRGERRVSQDVSDYRRVNALAVRDDGAVAWILEVGDGQYREVDGVAPATSAATPLAYARGIDPAALTFGADSVTWTQDGAARTTELRPPPPPPAPSSTPGPQGLDARFAKCGVLTPPTGARISSFGDVRLAEVPGGSFLAGTSDGNRFFVSRFSSDGQLDTGFGSGGVVSTTVPKPARAQDATLSGIVAQADGKVVVSGYVRLENPNNVRSVLVRYNADGTLDPSFGSNGIADNALPAGSVGEIDAIALTTDGRMVAAGARDDSPATGVSTGDGSRFTVARYLPDGSPDPTFGSGGIASIDPGFGPSRAGALLVDPTGAVVAAGRAGQQLALARFTPLGQLDGANYESPPASAEITALAKLPDGLIIAAGTAANVNGSFQMSLARYNDDGRPDTTFGDGGFLIDRAGSSPTSIVADSTGRLLVTGTATFGPLTGSGSGLIRYAADGSRDTGFGIAGALVGFSSFGLRAGDVLVQPDGTALVAEDNGGSLAAARFAVDEPALGATAGEPRACSVRVTTKSLAQLLRPGKNVPYGKLGLAFERRQPGRLVVRAVAKVGGRSATIGTTTRDSTTFGKDIATIRVSRGAWKLLRGAAKGDIVVTAVGTEGGATATVTRTLRR